jgi:hypothetical protein
MVFSGHERPAERLNGSLDFSQTWGDGYLASAISLSL